MGAHRHDVDNRLYARTQCVLLGAQDSGLQIILDIVHILVPASRIIDQNVYVRDVRELMLFGHISNVVFVFGVIYNSALQINTEHLMTVHQKLICNS